MPTMASSRIQRWALTLEHIQLPTVFRTGKDQGNADGISRLPLAEAPEEVPTPEDTILMVHAFLDRNSCSFIHPTLVRQRPCGLYGQENGASWMENTDKGAVQAFRVQEYSKTKC